ncbi:MAG: hypothetical protein ACK5JF_08230 [Oscillospiraceae bacterium]
MKQKRFKKLLMGRFGYSRNEAQHQVNKAMYLKRNYQREWGRLIEKHFLAEFGLTATSFGTALKAVAQSAKEASEAFAALGAHSEKCAIGFIRKKNQEVLHDQG